MAQVVTRTRADGGSSYQVRWQLGGSRAGAWQAETFTTDVRARAFKLDVEEAGHFWPKGWIRGEGYIQKSTNEKRFADVAKDYFTEQDRRIKRERIKPYTVHRYLRTYELHLQPAFGDAAFSSIQPEDVADWIDSQIEDGAAAKSVTNRHGLLFSIMSHGQKRMRLRPDNPCEVTELPEDNARDARQVRFFLHGEWALFRACLKQDVHLLVDVLLATGIRWGEVSALRVSEVTLQENGDAVMHIIRAWSIRAPKDEHEVHVDEGETPSWILGPPKNKRARYVVVSGEVAQRLKTAVDGRGPSEYVFQTRYGNPWRYQDFHSDRWIPARNDAVKRGLTKHATPHMLRHTTVVWSLAAGVPIQVISEMLGHASIQITYDIYGGLIDMRDPVLAQAMAFAMITVKTAIVPAPSREEVEARSIRPGPRGAGRRRAGS